MPTFSDAIHSGVTILNDGAGRTALRYLVALLGVSALFALYAVTQFDGMASPDAHDGAQIARHVAQGHGIATGVVKPLDVAADALPGADAPYHPELRRAPLFPWLLGQVFRLVRPDFDATVTPRGNAVERHVMLPLGFVLTALTALLTYRLGRRLFTPLPGVLGAVLYLLSVSVLDDAMSGTPRPLLALLAVAATLASVSGLQGHFRRAPGGRNVGLMVLGALLAGAGVLAGYGMLAVLIVLAGFLAHPSQRDRTTAFVLFIVLGLLVTVPWALRNYRLAGNVLGRAHLDLLHATVLFPGDSLDHMMAPPLHSSPVLYAIRSKLIAAATQIHTAAVPAAGLGLLGAFYLVSLFLPYADEATDRLRWSLLAGTLIGMAWGALTGDAAGAMAVIAPFAALYGVAALLRIMTYMELTTDWQVVVAGILVIVTALPMAVRVGTGRPARADARPSTPFLAYAAALTAEDEPIATDAPEALAWYGRRQAVALPVSPDALQELGEVWRLIRNVLLTPVTSERPYASDLADGRWQAWQDVLELRAPEDFPLMHAIAYPPETHRHLFLTDRVRWQHAPSSP